MDRIAQSPGGWRRLCSGLGLAALLLATAFTLAASPAATAAPKATPDGGAAPAAAAPAAAAPAAAAPALAFNEATVRFYNRDIATLRTEFMGRDPQLRARTAEAAIARAFERFGAAKLEFRESSEGTLVLLSGELVMLLAPGDLDVLNGETMEQARAGIERRLGDALAVAYHEQAPMRLAQGVLWSLLATAVAIALAVAALWLGRRIRTVARTRLQRRIDSTPEGSLHHVLTGVRIVGDWLLKILVAVGLFVIAEEWVRFVLDQFGFTRPWADAMTGWMLGLLRGWGQAIAAAMPGLFAALLIFLLARLLTRSVALTFRGVAEGRFKLFGIDQVLAEPTRKIINVVVWLFALVMAYPYLPGSDTDAFKGLSVLVGLMISLGASSIVGQAAGGLTILYSRTMTVGDYVRCGDVEGTVLQIGIFTTHLRTLAGVEVSIPNNVVLGGQLHNYSRHPDGPGMWLETGVTIGYDTPWRQVHRLLLEAASRTSGISADPQPFVLQTALSDFYVDYRLRVRVAQTLLRMKILSELHAQIQDAFNAEGVQIMSPNYEADPDSPKLVPREHWERLPAPVAADAPPPRE
ncbi:mechanosensitive ion channel family protein [Pseudoxanthomonas koreensis]|uniref:mechanosensitive ion channel family protein n=1 Tax=Pseudoxanthomonas koreensis TaxID=266061 RepID=UPI00139094E3|nr:mechanosensitive ion channel family protein [Pseudoxanthomonas koreensis]KAF1693405.1 mechanosensitive ion channel protein MscS [Pseudoxanthomonas koreensis]